MYRNLPSLTAAAALALSGATFAQDSTKSGGVPGIDVDVDANISMPMADKNSDGKVSKTEAASNQKLASQFDTLDKNKDGNLDKGEFAKFEAKGDAKGSAKQGAPATSGPGTTTDDPAPSSQDQPAPAR